MKINEFTEKLVINTPLLVTAFKGGVTAKNSPYLTITFRDNTGSIEGKLWDVKENQSALVKVGKVVNVVGEVINYNHVLQLKVINILDVEGEVDMAEFVMTGPYTHAQLHSYIDSKISEIENTDIYRIVADIYRTYDKEIYASAAATKNHHEFYSGLATHVYSMLKLAEMMVMNYPYLSKDLLYAGVLLHDIGKVVELTGGIVTEYTLEGKLIGHISLSQTIIKETASKLQIEGEVVTLLRHMVLAHHGQYEFGSPVLPMTIEAEALHFIDDIDAKMTMIEKELKLIPDNEFSQRNFALENRMFYKHTIK